MKYLLLALAVPVVLVIVWIVWRWTSVGRGARQRNKRLLDILDPLGRKFDAGEVVTKEEVATLAARPELRHMLFAVLRGMEKTELLPDTFRSPVDQAASSLAYWMMHPNELQDPPERIELLKTVPRDFQGTQQEFHVFRYRMPAGHWAGGEWLLGFAIAPKADEEPYDGVTSAFSRAGDIEGKVEPEDIVDWYINMLRQKGLHA